jgi:hypothetical protein
LFNFIVSTALVSVSEEVRSRCHVRHSVARVMADQNNEAGYAQDMGLLMAQVSILISCLKLKIFSNAVFK